MSPSPWFRRQPTLLPGRPLRPELVYRTRSVFGGFFMWMAFALYALYVVRDAGLAPYQLIAVAIVLELTVVAFEIPTGILADAVSRRLSVIAGTVISGVGWAVIGLFPSFEGVAAGQFLWGVGFTFMSGSTEAWLADEIGEDEAAREYPRAAQWRQVARISGVLAGAALGLLGTGVPFVAGGLGHVAMAALFLFTMTEAGWQPVPRDGRSSLAGVRQIAAVGLAEARRRSLVRAALAVAFLFGASSEVFDSLWSYHLLEGIGVPADLDAVLRFGGIAVVTELGGLAVIAVGRRVSRDGSRESAARVLSVLYAATVATALAFAFAVSAVSAVVLATAARATRAGEQPFFTMWVNRGLDPRTRATVLSTVGQANSAGQVAQGPAFAGIVGLTGVRTALALGALVVLPAAGLVRTRPSEERGEPEATRAETR